MVGKTGLDTPPEARAQAADAQTLNETEDWTSEAYDWLNGRRQRPRTNKCSASCGLTALFSLLLAGCGVAVLVWSLLSGAGAQAWLYLSGAIGVVLGALFLATGAIGFASLHVDHPAASALLAALLGLLALVVLTGGAAAAAVLARPGILSADFMRDVWVGAVEWDPRLVCGVQGRFGCSGYDAGHCCVSNETDSNATGVPCYLVTKNATLDPVTLREVTWPAEVCATQCSETNIYNETCEGPLENAFRDSLVPLTAALLSFGAFLVVFCVLAVRRAVAKRRTASYIQYEY